MRGGKLVGMRKPSFAKCLTLAIVVACVAPVSQVAGKATDDFRDGCCVSPAFPRPKNVSRSTVPLRTLTEALNCATNNKLVSGTQEFAASLGNSNALSVAYYYGKFLPEQGGRALTIAVYSQDGRDGRLFDIEFGSRRYFIVNYTDLRKGESQWRVGEINGGLASYTRLWRLAQEIGARPRQTIAVSTITQVQPRECNGAF